MGDIEEPGEVILGTYWTCEDWVKACFTCVWSVRHVLSMHEVCCMFNLCVNCEGIF